MSSGIYIDILIDATKEKLKILNQLVEITTLQEVETKKTPFVLESFDEYMNQKDELIIKLNDLDDGFDKLYKNVQEFLLPNKEQYKEHIRKLQSLIKEVLEKSAKLHVLENKVKLSIEQAFTNQKSEISKYKSSKRITGSYNTYQNNNFTESFFFDKKK